MTHTPEPPPLPDDVAARLQALARLRDRGSLSPEAYDAARAALLGEVSPGAGGAFPVEGALPVPAVEPAAPAQPATEPRAPWAWTPDVEREGSEESASVAGPGTSPVREAPVPVTPPSLTQESPAPVPPPPLASSDAPLPGPPPAEGPGAPPSPPPPPLALGSGWTPPTPERYPMRFDVDYPASMSRWKTFLRLVLFLPPYLVMQFVGYVVWVVLAFGWMAVFWRKKYPDWAFAAVTGAFGYQARAMAYGTLVTDRFPSLSKETSPVTLDYDFPAPGELSRWRVILWKSVLLVPHLVALSALVIANTAVTVIAWFGILVTGNYPRGLFQFSVGVQRWNWRLAGYFASFNDRFPPFALADEASPASNGVVVANGIVGAAVASGLTVLTVTAIVLSNQYRVEQVDYERLAAGREQSITTFEPEPGEDPVELRLTRAVDPGDSLVEVLSPARGERVIVFQWAVVNDTGASQRIDADAAKLKFSVKDASETKSKTVTALILTANNSVAPVILGDSQTVRLQAVFVVPSDAEPLELRFAAQFGRVKYEFLE